MRTVVKKALKNTFLLGFLFCSFEKNINAQKTWVGAGAGGAGTNFNTGANWSPVGVPIATDNVIIAITSDATITLSANASINNLTFTVNGSNDNAILSVGAFILTVNGNSVIDILSGNANTDIQIGVNGGTSAGVIDFAGTVSIGTTNAGNGAGFNGNTNSKLVFRNNVTFGVMAFVNITNRPGTIELNGAGTQTLTWNNTTFYCEWNNVEVGNTNNPTINQITGTAVPDNILGNLTVNGSSVLNLGTSRWNGGTAGGGTGNAGTLTLANTATLQLGAASGGQTGSNFPLRFATLSVASGSTVEYTGTSAQTVYDIASPGYGNLTVTNSSTKSPTSGLDIRGNLLINSTATFSAGTGLSHNLAGNLTNNNVFTAITSTMIFNGATPQTIGGSVNTTFYNLTANNTAGNTTTGISLARPSIVTNTLTLSNGHITTTTTNLLTMNAGSNVAGSNFLARVSGGSNDSFVNGPMRKIGNTDFLFPVGKITAGHRYCGLSGLSTGNEYQAEFIRSGASALGSITAPGLSHVSYCEYWDIDRITGTNANVTLSWNGNSSCNIVAYVTDLTTLVAAHFGTSWDAFGNDGGNTGAALAGSVTWNGVSVFSPFSLGSTSAITNPLPVKLTNAKAFNAGAFNQIEWQNLTEASVYVYEVQKSVNGLSFETLSFQQPKANDGAKQDYVIVDNDVLPVSYYRVKITEHTGQVIYSSVMRVESETTHGIIVYPNPVKGRQVTLMLTAPGGQLYVQLIGMSGQQMQLRPITHSGGNLSATIELPANLPYGYYILKVFNQGTVRTAKILVE